MTLNLKRRVWRKAKFGASYTSDVLSQHEGAADDHEANVVCSDLRGQAVACVCSSCGAPKTPHKDDRMHMPVLDLDFPVTVLESSTPGHHHLYLDKPVRWDDYCVLLDAMARCGLLEKGYVHRSKARGYTALRLPWIEKSDRGI